MSALIDAARRDGGDNARAKALYALSCLIRGNANAQKAFALGEGVQLCAKLIAHPGSEKVRVKALVLARHVVTQSEANMACAIEFNMITAAAGCLSSDDINAKEAAARLLLDIARCCDFEKSPKADDFRRSTTTRIIADARATIAALTDEDDIAANTETKIALDSLAAMFA
jgi:hsp70-interacting protein